MRNSLNSLTLMRFLFLSCVIYLARILQCVKTCKFALPAALDRSIHPVTLASGSSVAQLRRLTCARLVLE